MRDSLRSVLASLATEKLVPEEYGPAGRYQRAAHLLAAEDTVKDQREAIDSFDGEYLLTRLIQPDGQWRAELRRMHTSAHTTMHTGQTRWDTIHSALVEIWSEITQAEEQQRMA